MAHRKRYYIMSPEVAKVVGRVDAIYDAMVIDPRYSKADLRAYWDRISQIPVNVPEKGLIAKISPVL